jgi:release factor glutamine methyltransferase
MSSSETWNIGRLLTWTTDYLKQHGSESARLDAEVLLAFVRRCPRIELYTAYQEPADEATLAAFRQLVRRRAAGEPVAYLVGHREFYSLDFQVTPDVLIPRPDTELVVLAVLDRIKEHDRSGEIAIADVGTGSGVIAIAIATQCPGCRVIALDRSAAALAIAGRNANRHEVSDRVTLVESDLFGALPPEQQFDFIASNPPYVREWEFESLSVEVQSHEPKAALVAGPRGTEVIERLIDAAPQRLRPGGWLIVEIGPLIVQDVERYLSACDGLESGPTLRDLAGLPRVVQARRRA